jgi:cytidine deaminase
VTENFITLEQKKLSITFDVFEDLNGLPHEVQTLFAQAIDARKNAYAPYSQFQVGAALLLDNGEIVIGSNQENAAYPSGLCAERVAIFSSGALFPQATIKILAITATSIKAANPDPIPPCGACRQSIAEYELKQNEPIAIYFMGATGKIVLAHSIKDLLPLMFDKKYL